MMLFRRLWMALSLSLLTSPVLAQDRLTLSMLPVWSPEVTIANLTPLAEHLSQRLGQPVEPLVHSNFKAYMDAVNAGEIDIAYASPSHYTAYAGVHDAVAMASKGDDGTRFRGVIITRKDSAIRTLADLEGKTVGYNGPNASGAYLSQRITLLEAGIDPETAMTLVRSVNGKQANITLSVYLGELDAGFIREGRLASVANYIPISQLHVLAHTAWLPNWALSVNRALPTTTHAQVRDALVTLDASSPLLRALKLNQFVAASDSDYDILRTAKN